MKRKISRRIKSPIVILLFGMVLFFSGCAKNMEKEMYIEVAQLTEKEQQIASLLGAGSDHLLFDFKVDDQVQSMSVNTYQLIDGKWEMVSGGARVFDENMGMLALGFDNLAEGLRVALQSEKHNGADKYETELQEKEGSISRATISLRDKTFIEYEKEIPLVVQVSTSKNEVRTLTLNDFYTPERYVEEDYDYVYAIAVTFSQKTVNELEEKEEG